MPPPTQLCAERPRFEEVLLRLPADRQLMVAIVSGDVPCIPELAAIGISLECHGLCQKWLTPAIALSWLELLHTLGPKPGLEVMVGQPKLSFAIAIKAHPTLGCWRFLRPWAQHQALGLDIS